MYFHKYLILFNFLKSLLGAALTLSALGYSNAQTPVTRAIAFKPAPASMMSEAQIAALCARLYVPCDAKHTKAWLVDAPPLPKIFLIDAARPALIAVPDVDRTRIAHYWDYSSYVHSRAVPGDRSEQPLAIYPALYPIGNQQYAVALEQQRREGYSGGGAMFSVADFVALNTTREVNVPHQTVHAGVPFSCSKMVRACFSEREYQTSRHCHDETEGYLTIQFPARGAPGHWAFTWHETHWPAHVTKAHTRRTLTRFTPSATSGNTLPSGVSFCSGPQ